jgi:hypothetical protein
MRSRGFERMAVAKFLAAGSAVFLALALVPAHAQFVNPVPPPPPPVFNPSTPNTVAPPGETPVPPTLPSPAPVGSELPSPSVVSPPIQPIPPSTETQPQPPAAPSTAATSKVAKARAARHPPKHYRWSHRRGNVVAAGPVILGPVAAPYYHSLLGWGIGPYPCEWRREWDGYWVRDCL